MTRRKSVDLERLPSNHETEVDRPEIEPITTGKVKTRSGGGFAREVRNIGNSLFAEIVIPAIKAAIVDFFSNGINMAMFGSDSRARRPARRRPYNKMYGDDSRRRARTRNSSRRPRTREEPYDDIFFDNREDAQQVLGRMMELVAEYGVARIGDLYSLVGLASNYTHERWGWDDLEGVRVHYTSEGYTVDFPEPDYID